MTEPGAYYFGCTRGINSREAGHFFYDTNLRSVGLSSTRLGLPWEHVDGVLAPRLYEGRYAPECPQGEAALHHKDGWTALAFWDRTGDSRGNSSSTFFFEGTLDYQEALARARVLFPAVLDRFEAGGLRVTKAGARRG